MLRYHFVTYLPLGDTLYELDGLSQLPKSHGKIPGGPGAWIDKAKEVLEFRMSTYTEGEVHFNLVRDDSCRSVYDCVLTGLQQMAIIGDRLESLGGEVERLQATMESSADESFKAECSSRLVQIQADMADEQAKRERWSKENVLRRSNLTGLAVALLSELAKAGKLSSQIEAAKQIMTTRRRNGLA